jgi:glutamate synthase (NADPH/NADH) small chain
MTGRGEEIHHAEEEGVIFKLLTNPVAFEGDDRGMVRRMKCLELELGEPDDSGRRRPVPVEGSEFYIETDLVIVAIGSGANPLLTKTTPGLKLNRWGYVEADDRGRTSREQIWSGGDIVTGSVTVIEAMGAGRRGREVHLEGFAALPAKDEEHRGVDPLAVSERCQYGRLQRGPGEQGLRLCVG